MKNYLRLIFIINFSFLIFNSSSSAQLSLERSEKTPQQKLLRSQIKKAEGKSYYPENENNLRDTRAVIFYDDFSVPGNWTMTNTSSPSYDWEILDSMPSNLTNQNFAWYLNSTSGGNFAIVNSNSQGNLALQNCNITNVNSFDCSSNTNVLLTFENYHRIYYENHTVFVSNDGVNFDSYPVNTNYGAGNNNYATSSNIETVNVNISPTASLQSTVWLRFNYVGSDDWFWIIDDVTVMDMPPYFSFGQNFGYCDLASTNVMGERIEHTIVPPNQIRDMKFIGDIKNAGAPINDSKLKMEVYNSSSIIIHSDTSTGSPLPYNWKTDSIIWTSTTNVLDQYSIDFSLQMDSASVSISTYNRILNYAVSDVSSCDGFARDNSTYSNNGLWNGPGNPYILGNEFTITNNLAVYGIYVAFTGATEPGAEVCAILYEMDPNALTFTDVFVPVVDNCLDGIEYTIQNYDLPSGNIINWTFLPFALPYTLQAGKSYVAAVNYNGGLNEVVIMNGGNTIRGAVSVYVYDPTATTGGPWFYTTTIPMIRLYTNSNFCGLGFNESDLLSSASVSPNPATNNILIDFTLTNNTEVSFSLIDITGKEILNQNLGNKIAGEHSLQIDLSEFSAGIYFCKLKAGNQEQTIKLIKSE